MIGPSPTASVAAFDESLAVRRESMNRQQVLAMAFELVRLGPLPDESTPDFLARVLDRMQSEAVSLGLDPIGVDSLPDVRARRVVAEGRWTA